MKYRMTIPCRPRRIGGVDENMKTYKWCRDHLYEFVGYEKTTRSDGTIGWCWIMEKVMTDREEKIATQSFELGKWIQSHQTPPDKPKPQEPVKDRQIPEKIGMAAAIIFWIAIMALLWTRFVFS